MFIESQQAILTVQVGAVFVAKGFLNFGVVLRIATVAFHSRSSLSYGSLPRHFGFLLLSK